MEIQATILWVHAKAQQIEQLRTVCARPGDLGHESWYAPVVAAEDAHHAYLGDNPLIAEAYDVWLSLRRHLRKHPQLANGNQIHTPERIYFDALEDGTSPHRALIAAVGRARADQICRSTQFWSHLDRLVGAPTS